MRAEEAARRALVAVARLTILAGAAGCAGNIVVGDKEAPVSPDPGDAVPNLPPDFTMDPPGGDCFEGASDTASCCDDLLVESFADGSLLGDPSLATDEEKACCELAVATMDAWMGTGEPPFDYSMPTKCCSSGLVEGGWDAHPSCTPWGPPMPPAMLHGFDLFDLEVVA